MNKEQTIAQLIAYRDGEPYDLQVLEQLSGTQREQMLQELGDIKDALEDLPDLPVPPMGWTAQEVPAEQSASFMRFPLATAAATFFVSAVLVFAIAGGGLNLGGDDPAETVAVVSPAGSHLAGLMARSRDLEQQLYGQNSWLNAGTTETAEPATDADPAGAAERQVLFRLADVDGQIAQLYESGNDQQDLRIALWSRRVELLENLVVMRAAARGGRGIYLNDGRSL